VELVPFRSAIQAGVKVVMSAHISLPGVDPGQLRPGTVAPNVLTGILVTRSTSPGWRDRRSTWPVAEAYGTEVAVRAFPQPICCPAGRPGRHHRAMEAGGLQRITQSGWSACSVVLQAKPISASSPGAVCSTACWRWWG
jgi:hypothetical protein